MINVCLALTTCRLPFLVFVYVVNTFLIAVAKYLRKELQRRKYLFWSFRAFILWSLSLPHMMWGCKGENCSSHDRQEAERKRPEDSCNLRSHHWHAPATASATSQTQSCRRQCTSSHWTVSIDLDESVTVMTSFLQEAKRKVCFQHTGSSSLYWHVLCVLWLY